MPITQSFTLCGEFPVCRIGFGAMRLTGPNEWGPPANWEQSLDVALRAVELGASYLDTADAYGPGINEEQLAEALHPYPDGLVIGTKAGQSRPGPEDWVPLGRPEYLRQQCELSLRRLRVDQISLFWLHRVDPLVSFDDQMGALKQLQEEGKIRHIGLSEVSVAEIERARGIVDITAVQNLYNLLDRRHEPVVEYCDRENIAFVPWLPVAGGKLTEPSGPVSVIARELGATAAQVALAWLLHRSPVIIPIPGTSSIKHLEENMSALTISLTGAQIEKLSSLASA